LPNNCTDSREVKSEISQKLKKAEADIRALGPKRGSQAEHSQYLIEFASNFQRIVSLAVNSEYSRSDILSKDNGFRIATEAVNRGQKFANDMAAVGGTYSFQTSDIEEFEEDLRSEYWPDDTTDTRTRDDHPDIQDLVSGYRDITNETKSNIITWLKEEYRDSRGFELGTFDSSLLASIMKQQATNWHDLALGYISDIISLVHSFILGVLESISPSDRVCEGVKSSIADDMARMYENAISQTKFLLSVELDGTPATYNHYFNETLEKW
jgi:hypothetical protein